MTGPWEIIYQRNVDGVESLVNLSVSVSDNSFKFEGLTKGPPYLQRPNVWPLYLPETVEVEFKFEIKSNSALMLYKSNIRNFEQCLAQTNWQYDNQKFKGSFGLEWDNNNVIDSNLVINFNPFSLDFDFNGPQAKIKTEQSPTSASFSLWINNFGHCLAQTNQQYDNQRLRGSCELEWNANAVIDTSFAIELNPFSSFEFVLKEKIG